MTGCEIWVIMFLGNINFYTLYTEIEKQNHDSQGSQTQEFVVCGQQKTALHNQHRHFSGHAQVLREGHHRHARWWVKHFLPSASDAPATISWCSFLSSFSSPDQSPFQPGIQSPCERTKILLLLWKFFFNYFVFVLFCFSFLACWRLNLVLKHAKPRLHQWATYPDKTLFLAPLLGHPVAERQKEVTRPFLSTNF